MRVGLLPRTALCQDGSAKDLVETPRLVRSITGRTVPTVPGSKGSEGKEPPLLHRGARLAGVVEFHRNELQSEYSSFGNQMGCAEGLRRERGSKIRCRITSHWSRDPSCCSLMMSMLEAYEGIGASSGVERRMQYCPRRATMVGELRVSPRNLKSSRLLVAQ